MMTKQFSLKDPLTSLLLIVSLLLPLTALANGSADKDGLTEDQRIMHVLNRLGFGARPGDVEKVKVIGLGRYIEQQLNPASIDDSPTETKVQKLDIFKMTTAELFAKYPNPAALLRALELESRNGARNQNGQNGRNGNDEMTEKERVERRRRLQEIYVKYDLRPAQQLIPQITANRMIRAVYSERQLQEVMVDFWQNHFNVFAGKAALRWYIPSYERDVLRKNALGNFRDLVVGTASHPAMLFYLDNFESVATSAPMNTPNPQARRIEQAIRDGNLTPQMRERLKQRFGINDAQLDERIREIRQMPQTPAPRPQQQRRGLNENYARELMELHTLGVDGGYTQTDIVEVAKAFSGWTIVDPRGYRRSAAAMINGTEEQRERRIQRQLGLPDDAESGTFFFNARWHDNAVKTVLGQKINEGGVKDGLKVIDILVDHPSTARFIATKLARRFVNDSPSRELIGRVAKAFQDSKGDIKSTLRALFNDPDFFTPANYRAKIKTPFELAVSAVRAIGADTNASPAMVAMLNKLGEVPYGYQAPTGYPDMAENWVNTGALLERLNYAVALSSGRIPGTRVDLTKFEGEDKHRILEKTLKVVLHDEVSPQTRETLMKQIDQPLPEPQIAEEPADDLEIPNFRGGQEGGGMTRQPRLLTPRGNPEVFKIVSLVLGTPEFQRQ